jgi:hypothetical protein
MRRIFICLVVTAFAIGAWAQNSTAGTVLTARVIPNVAPDSLGMAQQIAGELAAGTEWSIRWGRVKLRSRFDDTFSLKVRVRGLIVPVLQEPFSVDPTAFPFPVPNPATCADFGFPAGVPCFGFSPSPFFVARVVCHDEDGNPSVAATTPPAPLSEKGNGRLKATIDLPDLCFGPIVLIGGVQQDGTTPGRWFAVSGF